MAYEDQQWAMRHLHPLPYQNPELRYQLKVEFGQQKLFSSVAVLVEQTFVLVMVKMNPLGVVIGQSAMVLPVQLCQFGVVGKSISAPSAGYSVSLMSQDLS